MVSPVGEFQEASRFALIFSLPAWVHPESQHCHLGWMNFLVYKTEPPPGASGETGPAQACRALRAGWPGRCGCCSLCRASPTRVLPRLLSKSVSPPLSPEQPSGRPECTGYGKVRPTQLLSLRDRRVDGGLSHGVSDVTAPPVLPSPTSFSNSNGDVWSLASEELPWNLLSLPWGPSRSAVNTFDMGEQWPRRAFTNLCSSGLSDYIAPGSLLAQVPVPPISFATQHPCGPLGLRVLICRMRAGFGWWVPELFSSVGHCGEKGCLSGFGRRWACCPGQHVPSKALDGGMGEAIRGPLDSDLQTPSCPRHGLKFSLLPSLPPQTLMTNTSLQRTPASWAWWCAGAPQWCSSARRTAWRPFPTPSSSSRRPSRRRAQTGCRQTWSCPSCLQCCPQKWNFPFCIGYFLFS